MLRLITAIGFLISPLMGFAQQPVFFKHRLFKVGDGLPQSFVSGLEQDKDGFLWVGTRDGLARYDGRQFQVFRQKTNDSLSISSNVITDLFLDDQNLLWIFYINEKIDCFDPRRLQVRYRDSFSVVRKLMAELRIKKFTRDRTGRFWFNTNYQGIVCYDPLTNKTTRFDTSHKNLRSNNNLGLAEDSKGRINVFTDKGIEMLNVKDKESNNFTPVGPSINFKIIPGAYNLVSALPEGRLALAETNRLIVFNPAKKTFSSHLLPAHIEARKDIIQQMKIGPDNLLYLVAAGGVYRFEKNNQFTWLWQPDNLNPFATDCKSFLIDQSGVIWFGTNAVGMYKVDMQSIPFISLPYKINFTADVASEILGSSANIPGSFKEGQWAYNLRYCYDRTNSLWITRRDNDQNLEPLSVYTISNNAIKPVPVPPGNLKAIMGFSQAPSGKMFAIDVQGNILRWENAFSQPAMIPSVLSIASTTIVVDLEADDKLSWVSTNKEGLFKIESGQPIKQFSVESGPQDWPGNQLTDLSRDPGNPDLLWIGSLGYGLIRLNKTTGEIKLFTTENGLPNNTIYSIVPDKKGNLWLSTNNGISRFSPGTNSFYNFDVNDGLIGNEFNRFHHLLLPDGRIAFGGPEGYTLFNPEKFAKDSFATKIGLTRLLINNKSIEFAGQAGIIQEPINQLKKLVLPYNKNFLQFEFAGLQFNQPEKIRYRYMLKGYDKEWIVSGSYNIAGYTRLPPGRYNLLLNASNTSGSWSPEIKELAIRVKPPFWATWWAYGIYLLIALLLIRVYWRYRANKIFMQHEIELEHAKANQLIELDEIKDRFFSNITHELRTPLTLILTPLEKLKDQNHYSLADQRILSNAYKNAEQLLRLINQLLDISKIESRQMKVNPTVGDLREFVETCTQQFLLQANAANIKLRFLNKNVNGLYFFDNEKWEKIIFNLLSNAIKFTEPGGEVTITIQSPEESNAIQKIQLLVEDTGKGIPETELPKLFDRFYMVDDSKTKARGGTGIGLALVKEMVVLMNGSIEVKSKPGKGSVFIVEIPTEKIISELSAVKDKDDSVQKKTIIQSDEKTEKPLVMVVEDNEELLSFLAESLSSNWRVLSASNGRTGWDMILTELPDFIISDVMMPEMDGYELCSRVKEDPRTAHIGFILLTARAAHDSRLKGLKTGANEYLTKPFHFDELELRLQNLDEHQKKLRNHLREELLPLAPLRKLPHVNDIFIQELNKQMDDLIIDPNMSIERLAQSVNMSQRTLNRKLKALLNLTPVEFVRQYRLQKAALLLSSGQGITDTAYSVGFETASYFSQCFKDQFGKTPTEFGSQKTA